MNEGIVIEWLKREGENVVEGEALVKVEAEKVVFSVGATVSGVLKRIIAKPGDFVTVAQPIATIETERLERTC